MKTKLCSMVCIICLLLGLSLLMTSCNSDDGMTLAGVEINANGELVLTYGNGTSQNLGVVVGKDGADGKDGIDGKDGKDGADGKDGKDGKDGIDGKDGTDGKDGQGGTVIIESSASNIVAASAKGLRSAVNIISNFKSTVQSGWYPGGSSTQEYAGGGSGIIYMMDKEEGDAFIITNYHVVYDVDNYTANGISDDINVYLYGSEYVEMGIPATYVGGSLYYDIAVLRIEDSDVLKNSDACAVTVADSDKVVVGSTAIAIGNAKGYGLSTSAGIVSVDSEYTSMLGADNKTTVTFRVMRVDAAVNLGNSGGGVHDANGDLIGIVNSKIVADGVEGIGRLIPSNIAVSVANNIIDHCYGTDLESVQRALLGVTLSISDSGAVYNAETGMFTIEETVFVQTVNSGALADGVLQEGDILLSFAINGNVKEVKRQFHLIDSSLDMRVGDVITLNILRDGEELSVNVTITEECLTAY